MSSSTFFDSTVLQVKVLFYTFVYLVLFIPLIILLLPVFLLRLVASQAKKVFRKDLDKLVHPRSSVLSCDNYAKNPRWNLVIWLTQDGLMDLDVFRKYFYEDYVLAKTPDGKLRYPEYQQHYETWWGFQFWRREDNFNINKHIRPYDGKHQGEVDDKKLIQIIKELTWKPWDPKQSPWEFLQIPKYRRSTDSSPNKSVLVFRLHHGLGDGYFILKLFLEDIGGISLKKALGQPAPVRRNLFHRIILTLFIWLVAPYHSMKMVTHAYDTNEWRIPEEKMVKPMNAALTEPIKLAMIKEVKNAHGVSFTSVIIAAITGGIRRMMVQKGVKVPLNIHTAVAVPIPGHPDKLRNHFIFSFLALPIGVSDPRLRLKHSEKNLINLKKSTAPALNFMTVPLFGCIYPWMMNMALKNRHSTCLLSNFPGSPTTGKLCGVEIIDMMFGAGLGPGTVGLGFTLTSLTDHIRLLSVADLNILETDEEVEELNRKILQEIALLKDLAPLVQSSTTV